MQNAKDIKGKYKPGLVPMGPLVKAISKVREYGTKKYGDPDNWRKVPVEHYYEAAMRHMIEVNDCHKAKDRESGIYHLYHVACNIAFILALEVFGDE